MPVHDDIINELKKHPCKELNDYLDIVCAALSEKREKLNKNDDEYIYYENHHILPKSLFPLFKDNKNNFVLLTPCEHFKCHKLLTKIFPSNEMTFALWLMTPKNEMNDSDYNEIKSNFAIVISNQMKGVPKTEEHKKHISESRIGLSYGELSENHKQKISESMKGNIISDKNREICSERCKSRTGSKNTQSRKVKCIEDNLIFDTVHQCEKYYNLPHLYRYCSNGKVPKKLNKHFEYV